MKRILILAGLMLTSQASVAAGFHYCTGEVTRIVTRATTEDTKLAIKGMNGYAKLGFGGDSYDKMHDRQFSMLLSAQMSGKEVTLEFEDNSMDCDDDHNDILIRYVSINPSD
ncbi:hypothetical protein ACJJIF_21615 [Microbulbifer sp. SSSA002]|uniref:hypothetical protein n=1 Tax=Microbulbifer sp. SSSA002 TaxID=3243376 RepID=UPI00403A4629